MTLPKTTASNFVTENRTGLLISFWLAVALLLTVVGAKISTANYSSKELVAHIEIDGRNYGAFDAVQDLSQVATQDLESYKTITLQRDFVTEPSLYLWAKNTMSSKSELKDINVVVATADGEELSRYTLKYCQPLSWAVEAANPALGGFHEKIDLAVQEVSLR